MAWWLYHCLPLGPSKASARTGSPGDDRGQMSVSLKGQGLTRHWSQSLGLALGTAWRAGLFSPVCTQGGARPSPQATSGHKGSAEVSSCHITWPSVCVPLGSVPFAWAAGWHRGWAVGKREGGGLGPSGYSDRLERTSAASNRARAHGDLLPGFQLQTEIHLSFPSTGAEN